MPNRCISRPNSFKKLFSKVLRHPSLRALCLSIKALPVYRRRPFQSFKVQYRHSSQNRPSDISARSGGNLLNSILKYSGEKLSILQHTPPSLEIARKGLRARVEDITLADFQMNEQVSRDSFGINEFFDTNAYKDTLSLDLNFDNPANFSTPVLSPQASRLVENTTAKKKKNFFNQTTVYKLGKKEIMRKYEEMCIKQSENQSFFLFKEFRVEFRKILKFYNRSMKKMSFFLKILKFRLKIFILKHLKTCQLILKFQTKLTLVVLLQKL